MAVVVGTFIKLEQDRVRSAAFRELRQLGFEFTIGSNVVRYAANRGPRTESELRELPKLFTDCARRYDLGFSQGLEIEMLDLRGSGASDEIVDQLKARFPRATILQ